MDSTLLTGEETTGDIIESNISRDHLTDTVIEDDLQIETEIETQLQIIDNETTPINDTQQDTNDIQITPLEEKTETVLIETTPTLTNADKENTQGTPLSHKKPVKKMSPRSYSSPSVTVTSRPKTTPTTSGRRNNTTKKTFKPTVPKPFNFSLDQRLEDRNDYEKRMKRLRQEMEEKEKQHKQENDKQEAEEMKSIRKSLVHKARPIQYYDPITIVPSEKPLTVPDAPNLKLGQRNRSIKDKNI